MIFVNKLSLLSCLPKREIENYSILNDAYINEFDFINWYDDLSVTPLNKNKRGSLTKSTKEKLKFDIYSAKMNLGNLMDQRLVQCTVPKILNPIGKRNGPLLKEEEKYDYIICLSHLGYTYDNKKVSVAILVSENNTSIRSVTDTSIPF